MEELMKILTRLHPDVDFGTEEHLIDKGILDSFDIVALIAEIQDVFGISIDARRIVPENFNSAQNLYRLIEEMEEAD